jgi:hypothetical protein
MGVIPRSGDYIFPAAANFANVDKPSSVIVHGAKLDHVVASPNSIIFLRMAFVAFTGGELCKATCCRKSI